VTGLRRWAAVTVLVGLSLVANGCDDKKEPPVAPLNPLADSADQVMFGLHTLLTDKGMLRAELLADTAFFFDNNTRIELRRLTTTFFNQVGAKTSVLTSEQGTYNTARAQTEARRHVVIVTPDAKRLTSEQVRYQQATNQILSDSAFVFTDSSQTLRGIGFVSDPSMSNIKVLKVLSGGGTFTLPGTGADSARQTGRPAPAGPGTPRSGAMQPPASRAPRPAQPAPPTPGQGPVMPPPGSEIRPPSAPPPPASGARPPGGER